MNKDIKVAHITSQITGGAGIAALRLHNKLQSVPNISSALIQKYPIPEDSKNIFRCTHFHSLCYRMINRLGLKDTLIKEEKYKKWISKQRSDYEYVSVPFSSFPIETHLEILKADIIHLHWVADFLNYPSFFAKINKPIVWTLHDMNPFLGIFHYEEDMQRNAKWSGTIDNHIKKVKSQYIHNANDITIVCLNEWMKTKSENSNAFSDYSHTIIPNGMDLSVSEIRIDKDTLKKEYGINNNYKTLFATAQNLGVKRKGVDLLSDALSSLDRSDYNIITLGGVKPDFNCSSHIHFEHCSDINKINSLYKISDVTIISSREDNLPNVMLESFANGTPVLSFANGGMAEHVITGKNGILLKEISAKSLKVGISKFLENEYTFDRQIIEEYAKANFSDTLLVNNYTKLYRQILSK